LEKQAGRGGQAVVFLALDTKLERKVAVKVCTAPPGLRRQMFVERFEREMRLTSRVDHPHVLQIYDCGELQDGTPYVLLEWMPFGSLDGLIHRSRIEKVHIPLDWVHYYASAITAGVRASHAVEIVHRDIKPDNVLIGRGGVAKLMDFGIARDNSPNAPTLTEFGQTIGTAGFMAPEHLSGRPVPQSDLFSLGVTVYTLLAGVLPAQGKIEGIANGHIQDEAWEQIPASFTPLLQRLTAPHVEDRFANCEQVLDGLEGMELGEDSRSHFPVGALPPLPSRAFVSGMTTAFDTHSDEPSLVEGFGDPPVVGANRPFGSGPSSDPGSSLSSAEMEQLVVAATRAQVSNAGSQPSAAPGTQRVGRVAIVRVAAAVLVAALGFGGYQFIAASCGNGLLGLSEACDDGNSDDNDACLNTCQPARCGDGFVRTDLAEGEDGFEGCDDGNLIEHDTCTNQCSRNVVFMHGSGPDGPVWWQGSKEPVGKSKLHRSFSEELEMPATPVLIEPFWILRNEVTQAAYAAYVEATDAEAPKTNFDPETQGNYPAVSMGLKNAAAYCAWLGGNLPLEVQWEYAARSGGEDIEYPWGNDEPTSDLAILGDHRYSEGHSWPVCSKPAGNTAQGLCDMAGNVWEYVRDGFGSYQGPPPKDPKGKPYRDNPELPSEDGKITIRGGGFWHTTSFWLRTRARYPYDSPEANPAHGFRCIWGRGSPPY